MSEKWLSSTGKLGTF